MNGRPGVSHAFTLIELLVVVAIISILASIAVPNFAEAQTRAKVVRVQADMRAALLVAVETYLVDHSTYPVRHTPDEILPRLETKSIQMSRLTTPIAYLTSLPVDIFAMAQRAPNNGIDYYDPRQVRQFLAPRHGMPINRWDRMANKGWLMISVGPDGKIGAPTDQYLDYPPQGEGVRRSLYAPYDATNGTVSVGNIFRFQLKPENPADFLYARD